MLPSFSLVIESYNARSAGLARLRECLDSIAGENPPPGAAREVLLLDDGGAGSVAQEAAAAYPWLRLHPVPPGLSYGDMKAVGVDACTGEVVVLLDSDCVYEPGWLQRLLSWFAADPTCMVVTGEVEVTVTGPCTLAAAVLWMVPGLSGERAPAPARYYGHPTALRRCALERCPFPLSLPLVRGQGVIHALALRAAGHTIWRDPLVRTNHPVPPLPELVARTFAQGHDSIQMARLTGDRRNASHRGFLVPLDRSVGRTRHIAARARSVLAADRRRLALLPAALPIGALLVLAYLAGRALTRVAPRATSRLLGVAVPARTVTAGSGRPR